MDELERFSNRPGRRREGERPGDAFGASPRAVLLIFAGALLFSSGKSGGYICSCEAVVVRRKVNVISGPWSSSIRGGLASSIDFSASWFLCLSLKWSRFFRISRRGIVQLDIQDRIRSMTAGLVGQAQRGDSSISQNTNKPKKCNAQRTQPRV